jgi:hypothetical protein
VAGAIVYLRDAPTDTGSRPLRAATWNSPDIWLRQTDDHETGHQMAKPGQTNALYTRVTNRGPAYAYEVQVEVFVGPAAPDIRREAWQPIGRLWVPWLKPGETVLGPLSWTPLTSGPFAFLARLSTAEQQPGDSFDPLTQSGVAQCKQWIAKTQPGQPVEVGFGLKVANTQGGITRLAIQRGDLPADAVVSEIRYSPAKRTRSRGAGSRGVAQAAVLGAVTGGLLAAIGPDWQANLTVTLPPATQPGKHFAMAIDQLQGGTVVGRLTVSLET